MKFYAIVLTGKEWSTLFGAPETVVFETVEAAEAEIEFRFLRETYLKVRVIEIGEAA